MQSLVETFLAMSYGFNGQWCYVKNFLPTNITPPGLKFEFCISNYIYSIPSGLLELTLILHK